MFACHTDEKCIAMIESLYDNISGDVFITIGITEMKWIIIHIIW